MPTISPFVSGFSHAPAAHSITSVNAAISTDQVHRGKPQSISQEASARAASNAAKADVARETIQRQAAPTSTPVPTTAQPHPQTTSYNAKGEVQAIEQAQTGRRFHAEA
ncbi:hypothetical protein SAMN05444156_0692 [Verrucomicrobium sp. GAS474]|uniref:hypothetical protein n=1 Tax=Verrucomicrobium sp. GAS474 TaxID=1882831 RepID=UPI00087BAA25|nr:hypothetical protein [Verrucomicrobium sp. GAS474]SDT91421.1 hypothetical protein SAMN05444156_0692 [Verrucomicrobium sp. GAS474]